MKVYKASYRLADTEHQGYQYFSNRKDAEREQRKNNLESGINGQVEEVEFELTKKGIIDLLNSEASHADNG